MDLLLLLALFQLVKARPQKYVRLHLLWVEAFMTLNKHQTTTIILINMCSSNYFLVGSKKEGGLIRSSHNNATLKSTQLPILISFTTGYWLRLCVPLNTKQVILETFPKPISWLGMEKTS